MPPKHIELIIQKYLKNEISFEELQRLAKDMSVENLRNEIKKSIEIDYLLSKHELKIDDSKEKYLKILSRAKAEQERASRTKIFKLRKVLKYAALLLILLSIGYLVKINLPTNSENQLVITDEPIILELGNGIKQVIDLNQNDQIQNSEGEVIANHHGDKITYDTNSVEETLVYNTLSIPFGKKLQIELSDGTSVTLNAGTIFRFPEKFLAKGERQVFVEGEAFFNVTEDQTRPFVVNASDIDVTVLGTQFNVSTYPEDSNINTVLVSGSVKLTPSQNKISSGQLSQLLSPGEKGSWNSVSEKFTVENVDTYVYTAWVDGKLVFRNMPFKTIRAKLERHYNVSIENKNAKLDENTFLASFDIESIEEVMETFDRNFGIKYEIKDNKIIIN